MSKKKMQCSATEILMQNESDGVCWSFFSFKEDEISYGNLLCWRVSILSTSGVIWGGGELSSEITKKFIQHWIIFKKVFHMLLKLAIR